ncbi:MULTISPECIES: hypothetical protein [Bradyrhizobium]|uniref:hypothetical protein n=1 Tax=Bradyrhizobium TaxID=374 RepID=UPI0020123A25|nr:MULTISPECIES: hypothetical protein [Bradyrhizobium]
MGFDETGETASIRFQAQQSFTNRHGTIQGGFLAAMLDSATGIRALAALASAGGGGAHNNAQPTIVCNYIIRIN